MSNEGAGEFETTGWTLINELHGADDATRERIVARLTERYWSPIFVFFRRAGVPSAEAEDLVQGFFADVVLGRRLFERADASRGRLRHLFMQAARNYRRDVGRRERRQARAVATTERLAVEERFADADPDASPELCYDRRWAVGALEEAIRRAEVRTARLGLDRHWKAFHEFVLAPCLGGVAPPPLEEVARQCGFASRTHVASALKVTRRHVRLALREVAADGTSSPEEAEAEHRHLLSLLG